MIEGPKSIPKHFCKEFFIKIFPSVQQTPAIRTSVSESVQNFVKSEIDSIKMSR